MKSWGLIVYFFARWVLLISGIVHSIVNSARIDITFTFLMTVAWLDMWFINNTESHSIKKKL